MSKIEVGDKVVALVGCFAVTAGKEYPVVGVYDFGVDIVDDHGFQSTIIIDKVKLVEEAEITKSKNFVPLPESFKIRIKSEEHSAAVQKWLFENTNVSWWKGEQVVKYKDEPYLFVTYGHLTHSSAEDCFNNEPVREVVFETEMVVTNVIVPPKEKKKVEIFGTTYIVEDEEKLKKALEEAGVKEA